MATASLSLSMNLSCRESTCWKYESRFAILWYLWYRYGHSAFGKRSGVYLSKRWSVGANLRAGVEEKKFRLTRCALSCGGVKREGVKARAVASRCRKVRGCCPTKRRDMAVADGGGSFARSCVRPRHHQLCRFDGPSVGGRFRSAVLSHLRTPSS